MCTYTVVSLSLFSKGFFHKEVNSCVLVETQSSDMSHAFSLSNVLDISKNEPRCISCLLGKVFCNPSDVPMVLVSFNADVASSELSLSRPLQRKFVNLEAFIKLL